MAYVLVDGFAEALHYLNCGILVIATALSQALATPVFAVSSVVFHK